MSDINNTRQTLETIGEPIYQYNTDTNINIDNALAAILDKFDSNYIMDIIEFSIGCRFRPYDQPMPNIVYGYEQQFIELSKGFSSNQNDIAQTRISTYANIINTLCQKHNFEFSNHDDIDYYSATFYLYKFLISEFTNNIIAFFTNFLIKERYSIYNSFNLKEFKKNDAGMVYSNKLFVDEKLSLIHGNIGYVIENMSNFDIDLYSILDLIYADKEVSRYIFGLVSDKGNFFKEFYEKYALDPTTGPELQTLIKLNLQNCASKISDESN